VKRGYQLQCPAAELQPFEDVDRELRESFLRDTALSEWGEISWIHPSYRDLVITQLEAESQQRRHFLRHLSVDGLKLVLTDCGYDGSPRKLFETEDDWIIVCDRLLELAEDRSETSTDLMDALSESIDHLRKRPRNGVILTRVAEAIKIKWDLEMKVLNERDILSFSRFSESITPLPPFPNLSKTLDKALGTLAKVIAKAEANHIDADEVEESVKLIAAIQAVEPRLLRQAGIHADSTLLISLIQSIEQDQEWKTTMFEAEQYRSEGARTKTLADSLDLLANIYPGLTSRTATIAMKLKRESERCEERANEEDPPEQDDDSYDSHYPSTSQFDIDGVFADL
jgi:hypothetical protein